MYSCHFHLRKAYKASLTSYRRCVHVSRIGLRDSPLEEARKLNVQDSLHGYTVQSVTEVPDFSLVSVQLKHNATNARHLHLARKDSNNMFGVGFMTTPTDSTGISHILEHTTLCGSERYPVRDPFFKMLTRSLSTFMNAFTASDWTLYPFSTQNAQDYRNLLSVYCDCVFRPNLRFLDFSQEGWRLEHENPSDKMSPLIFKGVVFNEMKGVFANPENIFCMEMQMKLLPSHTYSHVSGGAPLDILDLTWDSLKNFHKQNYHPSNSWFFTYGDIPVQDHLQYINDVPLKGFTADSRCPAVPLETRWATPREHHITCAPDPMAPDPSKQTTVGVAYLLGPITDPYESLVHTIVCKLLVDGPASPFYQSLIDVNIGASYSPGTGYDNSIKESMFSVGLQGIKKDDVEKVKEIIQDTFNKVAKEGFSESRVKAVLHQIELSLKHQSSNFGLSLVVNLMSPLIHGADLVSMLKINETVNKFKEAIAADPAYLQHKIKEYFLDNRHRMTLTMSPSEKYEEELKAAEAAKLTTMISKLTEEDRERIYQQGMRLLEDQNKSQDASALPTLTIADVSKKTMPTDIFHEYHDGIKVQYSDQPTNGVTYFRTLSSSSLIPDDLKQYLPLFCNIITRMGAGGLDHRQFAEQCDLYAGGSLGVSTHLVCHHSNHHLLEEAILLSSHCLDRHVQYMLSLWEDIFTDVNLQDENRLRTLISMMASSLSMDVANSGHSFAVSAAAASLTPTAQFSELYDGLSQVKFMKNLAEQSDLSDVLKKMSSIAVQVLDTGTMRCSVNTCGEQMDTLYSAMEGFLTSIPGSATDDPEFMKSCDHTPSSRHTHYELPFPVNYVAQAYPTVPYAHEDAPRLRILARLMSWKYLHKEIREKGGAYGGGARTGETTFAFYSYRDPHSLETLDRFQDSINWACQGSFSQEDIDEARLSVFSQVDSPVSPGAKGSSIFLQGLSDEIKQQHRDRLFAVTKEELVAMATKYLRDAKVRGSAIIGPKIENLPSEWKSEQFTL